MENSSLDNGEFELNAELDRLFAAYREAIATPEAGAGFMPGLWRQIEARRTFAGNLRHWAHAFVTAAVGICLLLTFLAAYSGRQPAWPDHADDPDELAAGNVPEYPRYLELAALDSGAQENHR
ncbi:MAG TPA: hypothetical protein VLE22_22135 [Bryobacteraceae bacterium]|nr:hypothetical protein [Bryobacteraceae bacterium]